MNEELNKTIKEFYIKQQKLLDEMTNYSKTQLISIIEREMNENHYLRNEIGRLNNIINELEKYIGQEWYCFDNESIEFEVARDILDKLKQLKEYE